MTKNNKTVILKLTEKDLNIIYTALEYAEKHKICKHKQIKEWIETYIFELPFTENESYVSRETYEAINLPEMYSIISGLHHYWMWLNNLKCTSTQEYITELLEKTTILKEDMKK